MSFLTPLYALGILAIGLPILLHLIQQAPRKRKEFSSLMFLSPTPPKRTKRKKLDQILLLVFRCLILCLLALAFARPFLKSDNPFVKSDKIEDYYVFLVDSSASMMRGDLWNDALEELGKSLEEVQEEDRACIMHFDTRLVQVLGFDDWKEMGSIQGQQTAVERLRNVTLSWNATHLGAALINASEVLDEVLTQSGKPSPDSTLKIVVITDLQNGSRLDELQGYHWPENLLVEIHPLVPDQTTNAGLQLVGRIADSLDQDSKVQNRIRVTNSMDSEQESFQLEFQEISENGAQKLSSMDVYLLPGQSKVIQTPPMPAEEGNYMKVLLKDGGADYDNGLIVPPTESRKSLVFYIGEEDPNNPEDAYYYLQRVFQLTLDREVTVESQLVKNAPTQEMITRAQEADMIVVAGSPAKPWLPILQQYVRGGGRILFAMKNADMSRDLEKLLEVPALLAVESTRSKYSMLEKLDFTHPILLPFGSSRFSDFTQVHFWKYRNLQVTPIDNANVLAYYDDGAPAWIEVAQGKGQIFIMTSTWKPQDSRLALSTKFVVLLYSILDRGQSFYSEVGQHQVGNTITIRDFLSLEDYTGLQIEKPDGQKIPLNEETSQFSDTDQPGMYQILNGGRRIKSFAVNMDPAESRTGQMSIATLKRMDVPFERFDATRKVIKVLDIEAQPQLAVEVEKQQKLWRWLVLATLVVLILETGLAGWKAKNQKSPKGVS